MSSYIFLYLKISNFKKIEIIINDKFRIVEIDNVIELIFKKFYDNNSFNHYFPIYDNYEINNKLLISISNNFLRFFIKDKKN